MGRRGSGPVKPFTLGPYRGITHDLWILNKEQFDHAHRPQSDHYRDGYDAQSHEKERLHLVPSEQKGYPRPDIDPGDDDKDGAPPK